MINVLLLYAQYVVVKTKAILLYSGLVMGR
jgi:hypothetical protein